MQTPSINWQGKMLGRYRLLRLLGRGGMGEVWLADDIQLRRQVAIKMLPAVYTEDRNYLQAFMQEARTAASLEHPHILPVHDFGEEKIKGDEVITYLVMPHIAGGSLRERIQSVQGPFPMGEGLRYLRQAAQAIDYAHSKQVLHRDIKPANILLQQDWLLLADFGIAKILNETKRSRTHAGAGTPEYMAPEQAQGHAIGASDLYSLVVIAYQMLTGSVPFKGKTPYDTLIMQITASPEPLRNRQPSISPIVEAIVLRGLAKQAVQRQPRCTVFVDELEGALQGSQILLPNAAADQVEGDPDATMLAPWKKQSQRLGAVNLQPYNASSATPLPPTMQAGIVGPQTQPSQPQPSTWPGVSQPVSGGSYPQAISGPGIYPPEPAKGAYPPSAFTPGASAAYPPPPNGVNYPPSGYAPTQASGASISSGGPILGMMSETPNALATKKNTIGRRELLVGGAAVAVIMGGGVLTATMLHKSTVPVNRTQSQQGGRAIPAVQPGPQQLIKGIARLVLSGHNAGVTIAAWHPGGRYLVSAGQDGNVMLWDIESSLKKSNSLQTISTPMNKWKFADQIFRDNMSWSADGKLVAVVVAGENNKINTIEPFSNKQVQSYSKPSTNALTDNPFLGLAWSPVENILAATCLSLGEITLFDANHASNTSRILKSNDINPANGQAYETYVPSWSKDGRYLAGQTDNSKALIWDVKTGNVVQTLDFPSRSNKSFIFVTDIQQWSQKNVSQLAMVNLDAVQIWDALNNKLLLTFGTNDPGPLATPPNPPEGWVPHMLGLAWSPNGRYLAGGYARSNLIYVWDTENPVPSKSKDNLHVQNMYFGSNGHSEAISNMAWSPDGRYIATTSSDKTVIIWQVDGK